MPSGNFGNLTAGLIAKRIGLPVRDFVAATNVNDVVPEYLRSGIYAPRPSVRTVANAMDVGAPSNFERMRALYDDDIDRMRQDVKGAAFDDARVVEEIGGVYRGTAICWTRTARSPGSGCRGARRRSRRDRRLSGHGASGEVPRGRRAGDWPAGGAAGHARRGAGAPAPQRADSQASYPALVDLVLQTV